jgi:hypothetical protein
MRHRSAANRAASSPPVPARISRMTLRLSLGSRGQQQALEDGGEVGAAGLEVADVLLGHLAHVGVGEQLLGGAQVGLDLLVVLEGGDQRGDLRVLAREGEEAGLVLGDLRVAQHGPEFIVAIGDVAELGAELRIEHAGGAS